MNSILPTQQVLGNKQRNVFKMLNASSTSLLSAHYIVNFIIIVVVMVIFLGMSLDVYGIIKMYMLISWT